MDKLNCLVMGRDLFIFAMLSPAEPKRPSKDPALTGSIPEEDDDEMLSNTNPSIRRGGVRRCKQFLDTNIKRYGNCVEHQ